MMLSAVDVSRTRLPFFSSFQSLTFEHGLYQCCATLKRTDHFLCIVTVDAILSNRSSFFSSNFCNWRIERARQVHTSEVMLTETSQKTWIKIKRKERRGPTLGKRITYLRDRGIWLNREICVHYQCMLVSTGSVEWHRLRNTSFGNFFIPLILTFPWLFLETSLDSRNCNCDSRFLIGEA